MKQDTFDVIGVGLVAVDCLWRTPQHITRGEKHEVPEMILQGGAPAGSTTSQLGRLGYRTAFLACIGEDNLSAIARREFLDNGISDALLQRHAGASPALALCEVDSRSAERTVYYNLDAYRKLRHEDIPIELLRKARVLILDSFEIDAVEYILENVQGYPVHTVLDLEHGSAEQLRRCIALGTDVILPWCCAQMLTQANNPEAALQQIQQLTQARLLITNGALGSWAMAPNGTILQQPSFSVKATDTTGCGDAYHGGYAIGLLEGWPLAVRMEYGAWVASLVAQRLGGRTALPRLADLQSADLSALSADTRAAIHKLTKTASPAA